MVSFVNCYFFIIISFILHFLFYFVGVYAHVPQGTSGGQLCVLWELLLSFHHMGLRDRTQVVCQAWWRFLYLLSHLTTPSYQFLLQALIYLRCVAKDDLDLLMLRPPLPA